jgi:hypothetical protein
MTAIYTLRVNASSTSLDLQSGCGQGLIFAGCRIIVTETEQLLLTRVPSHTKHSSCLESPDYQKRSTEAEAQEVHGEPHQCMCWPKIYDHRVSSDIEKEHAYERQQACRR